MNLHIVQFWIMGKKRANSFHTVCLSRSKFWRKVIHFHRCFDEPVHCNHHIVMLILISRFDLSLVRAGAHQEMVECCILLFMIDTLVNYDYILVISFVLLLSLTTIRAYHNSVPALVRVHVRWRENILGSLLPLLLEVIRTNFEVLPLIFIIWQCRNWLNFQPLIIFLIFSQKLKNWCE